MKLMKIVAIMLLISFSAGLSAATNEKSADPVNVPVGMQGDPLCIQYVDFGPEIVPPPDKPLVISVGFWNPMDESINLVGKLSIPGMEPIVLQKGKWSSDGWKWTFEPIAVGLVEGFGKVELGGAKIKNGAVMMRETYPVCIGKAPLLDQLRYLVDNYSHSDYIFVQGYIYRGMLGLYELTGEKKYLDQVRSWVNQFLADQLDNGFWDTGYDYIFFADTGSALAGLFNFYKHATEDEKAHIVAALEKYIRGIMIAGDSRGMPFIHEDGSLGVGILKHKEKDKKDSNRPYIIATSLTGAQIFAGMYYITGNEEYKQIAMKACDWLLGTMLPNGQFPYVIDYQETGVIDKYERYWMWPYDTAGYVGEGIIAAWTYIDDNDFRQRLGKGMADHVEWLLNTQNYDGSWAVKGSEDQQRSHGVVDFLLWYHLNIKNDPRIIRALQKYYLLVLDRQRSHYFYVPRRTVSNPVLMMRAVVDIIKPGIDCNRWKD